jgi:2-octaprenyl-6-methoxyphenol hydroxylase
LEESDKSILLIEEFSIDDQNQPSYDERTVALTYSARQIYRAMGVWDDVLSKEAEPIKDIHISNRGHFGQTHLSHEDSNTEALGYVVPTRAIGKELWDRLSTSSVTDIICPGTVLNISQDEEFCRVELSTDDKKVSLTSKLLILSDGGRSGLSDSVGLSVDNVAYSQSAVLSIVKTDRTHNGRAYERFTSEGPLALLPMTSFEKESENLNRFDSPGKTSSRYAVVWTTENAELKSRMALGDDEYIDSLQETFGDRAGNFSTPSERKSYALKRSSTNSPNNGRVLLLGNAAHTVHPVAGQGFNLGLRDVAALAELIHRADSKDVGDENMMNQYRESRLAESQKVEKFTHSLVSLFCDQSPTVSLFRNLGLSAIEYCPPVKRFLLQKTMGMSGKKPLMVRGRGLNESRG